MPLTRVDGGDDAFDDENRKAVKTREERDGLADGRELGDHVQEEGEQSHCAEEKCSNDAVALARPLSQHEALRTALPDGRSHGRKHQQR